MVHDTHTMIAAEGLRRVYAGPDRQAVVAVDNISLNVPRGQTLAILGPNGAGKSTLMRMLTTLLPPTSGTAHVAGWDVTRDARQVRSLIGYVGQGNSAGHSQRARDEVIHQARIYGADRAEAAARATDLFATFGLQGLERRRTSAMSGGQRRRLDLAMGLVHHPSLLFLDEPTTGLDPQNRANLWDHIRGIRENTGMTVVVTTHYLDEADAMADRIVIVDHGRILADGTAHELKQSHVGDHVEMDTPDESIARALTGEVRRLPGVLDTSARGLTVRVQVRDGRSALPELIALAARQNLSVMGASTRAATLDDVFLTLTGRSLRDATSTSQEPA